MIESVRFRNFKVLRDTMLPLGRFTLIVGPNGSGKSTAIQALQAVSQRVHFADIVAAGTPPVEFVEVTLRWKAPWAGVTMKMIWRAANKRPDISYEDISGSSLSTGPISQELGAHLSRLRLYSLNADSIAAPGNLVPKVELSREGGYLAVVLDRLRDAAPERFEALNQELEQLLPEFDRILFDTPGEGQRSFLLRLRLGHFAIPAKDLSQGTLLALAILALAYLPDPASVVCLEEPDRGIHPRLLRDVRDALYRLSHPENFGENRPPVQVIATTHSPYFLDLFRDHPEEIVIAQKVGNEARFERLSDRSDIEEILLDAPLGEVWYSGILGGVPSRP